MLPEIFASIKETRATERQLGVFNKRKSVKNEDALGLYKKINGKNNKISDVRGFPSFDAEYQQGQDVVTIKSSAGSMILKKGNFFYSYRGVHKGLTITTTAYVTNGKISHIVYEELDKANNKKATVNYYNKYTCGIFQSIDRFWR